MPLVFFSANKPIEPSIILTTQKNTDKQIAIAQLDELQSQQNSPEIWLIVFLR